MKLIRYPIRRLFCLFLIISVLFCGFAWGGDGKRVLILPFKIHSEKDLTFLKNGVYDMLSSRLIQEGKVVPVSKGETEKIVTGVPEPMDAEKALALAEKAGADFVILGSLTVFGDSISTDVRFFDVSKKSPVVTFNRTGKTQGDVITHINLFAAQVNEQVFGRKAAAYSPAQPEAAVPISRKHPDKIWQESKGGAYVYGAQATEGQAAFAIWKSRKFKGAIKGVALGDVDHDGNNEVVFIKGSTIFIYRRWAGKFVKVTEIAEKRYNQLISVDVADINRNGAAEIFVTNLPVNSNTLRSFVLEWNGRAFEKISTGANWYYRVIKVPNRGKVLLGQERGMVTDTFGANALFSGAVSELQWKNGRLEIAERQLLPRGVNIYGFTIGDVLNDGRDTVAAFTSREFIRITDREGNVEWTSDERYGGSAAFLELREEKQEGDHADDIRMTRYFLPQRLHITDLDGDGKNELIVVKNHDITSQFLDQTRYYKSGHIECLAWDAIGMRLKWKTHKTGYISDYVIGDLDGDGKDEVVFAVVLKSGPILGKSRSYIASLALKAQKAK